MIFSRYSVLLFRLASYHNAKHFFLMYFNYFYFSAVILLWSLLWVYEV